MTEIDFEELSGTIRKRITKLYGSHNECEDAIQEATIRAWKDIENGITDYGYLVNRGASWAKAFLFNSSHYPTGDLGRSTGGWTMPKSDAIREKIKLYMQEYKELHGREPSIRQIQKGIGTKVDIARHIKTIKSSIGVLTRPNGGNRIDRSAYVYHPLPDFNDQNDDTQWVSNSDLPKYVTPSFEEGTLSDASFISLVSRLDDEELKRVLVLYYVEDWSQKEIGVHLGYSHPQATVARMMKKAYKILRQHIESTDDSA